MAYNEKDVGKDYGRNGDDQTIGPAGRPCSNDRKNVIVGFDQTRLAKIVDEFGRPKRAPLGLLAADAEQYFARHPEAAVGTSRARRVCR